MPALVPTFSLMQTLVFGVVRHVTQRMDPAVDETMFYM